MWTLKKSNKSCHFLLQTLQWFPFWLKWESEVLTQPICFPLPPSPWFCPSLPSLAVPWTRWTDSFLKKEQHWLFSLPGKCLLKYWLMYSFISRRFLVPQPLYMYQHPVPQGLSASFSFTVLTVINIVLFLRNLIISLSHYHSEMRIGSFSYP